MADRESGGETAPKLGVTASPLDDQSRSSLGLDRDTTGVLVRNVLPDGAAAHSGIRPGDVIERVGNEQVQDSSELARALAHCRNDTALLLVNRSGDESFVAVPLG